MRVLGQSTTTRDANMIAIYFALCTLLAMVILVRFELSVTPKILATEAFIVSLVLLGMLVVR